MNVNDLAAALQSEPASEETTGETEETLESQSEEVKTEYSEEAETELVDEDNDELDDESEPEETLYTVKVDGQEVQVTLDEALQGYQRDTDYRKKTMTLAEERKGVESEKARISETISEIDSFIKGEQENIDWETLKAENPAEYIDKKDRIAKAEQLKAKALEERQNHFNELCNKEAKQLVDIMGGNDAWGTEQRNKDMQAANEYLQGKGFKDQEIGQLVDHRFWMMIFDAAKAQKYKETETRVKEQVRKAPKSVKPGQKQTTGERKRRKATNQIKNATNTRDQIAGLADLLR